MTERSGRVQIRRIAAALVLVAVSTTALARAQKKGPPSLSEMLTGEAKAAYEEARSLFKAGDYAGSLRQLELAQKLSPNPRLFWNMAACEKKLGHAAKAVTYVEKYLAAGAGVLTDEERREGTDFVAAMRTLVGTVTVTSPLDGVQLAVDGELVGTTPFSTPIFVDAGEHKVGFSRAGYKEGARTEAVPAGANATWVLDLVPDVHEGRLVVTAGTGESIWLDGRLVGRGEWGGSLPSGSHKVLVTGPDKKSREQSLVIRDNEATSADLHLPSAASGSSTWLWVGGGALLVAGAIVGGYLLFKPSTPGAAESPKGTLGTFAFP